MEPVNVDINQLEAKFGSLTPNADDFKTLRHQVRSLYGSEVTEAMLPTQGVVMGESSDVAVAGLRHQGLVAAMNLTLAMAEIQCAEVLPKSKMQGTFSGGKVVYQCYHDPAHQFVVTV